ncbi:MAG TPA: hypothetical protein V6C84_14080 [Coleofasciculaceae cyanobacterium]
MTCRKWLEIWIRDPYVQGCSIRVGYCGKICPQYLKRFTTTEAGFDGGFGSAS